MTISMTIILGTVFNAQFQHISSVRISWWCVTSVTTSMLFTTLMTIKKKMIMMKLMRIIEKWMIDDASTPCVTTATSLSSILGFKATSLKHKFIPWIFCTWSNLKHIKVEVAKKICFDVSPSYKLPLLTKQWERSLIPYCHIATVFATVFASSVFGGIFAFDSDLVSDGSTTGSGMSARALESLSLPVLSH